MRPPPMTGSDVPRQPAAFRVWREAQDTRLRTRLGGIYYLLAWLLTWLFSAAPGDQLALGLGGIALFGSLLGLRLLHRLPNEQSSDALHQWLNRHWCLIFFTACAWGVAHAWVVVSPVFADSWFIATLSTIAFSTAVAFNFSMRKGRAVIALLLIYLPGLAAMGADWGERHAMLVTLAFYLSYLVLVLNRSHREYQATLTLELRLLEQQESLERVSRTDSLTQLGNRYQFNTLFPAMIAGAQRQAEPLSLVLLDIDFFKRINDQYGHAYGDAYLGAFAQRMREVFQRDSDALLRLGGEEFGVLMPSTPLEQARLLAQEFLDDLVQRPLDVRAPEGQDSPAALTASLGVGCYSPGLDGSAEAFFKRVDDALYRAKNSGRNRVALAAE
ncbi:GGDEF domain-containing protein [Pseudomonas borbori]